MSAVCYKLTNCEGSVFYTERNMIDYVNEIVLIDDIAGSWLVEFIQDSSCAMAPANIPNDEIVTLLQETFQIGEPCPTSTNLCINAIPDVSITQRYDDCNDCLQNCYKLTDCLTEEILYFQGAYLSAYIGKVIKFDRVFEDGYSRLSCFTVEQEKCLSDLEEFSFEILDCFIECEPCLPKCICTRALNSGTEKKRLAYTDCEGNRVFTEELIAPGRYSKKYCVLSWDDADVVTIQEFGDCENSLCPEVPQPKRFIAPGYNSPTCTPEQYEKILCNYAEQSYKKVLEDRYGIADCCPDERLKWEIKYELIKLEALEDPNIECVTRSCSC